MIITFLSLAVPSLAVTGIALAGLIICLASLQLIDFGNSNFKFLRQYISIFAVPLFVFFAVFMIIKVVEIAR